METTKLRAALEELNAQRTVLDSAIANLQTVLAMLNGHQDSSPIRPTVTDQGNSYIDDGVAILRNAGKPMHVKSLAAEMSQLRGKQISRASVESSFIRHITKTKAPRLVKTGRSTYGLPEWKQHPALVQVAS